MVFNSHLQQSFNHTPELAEVVKFSGLRTMSILFADDVVLLASTNSNLQLGLGQCAASGGWGSGPLNLRPWFSVGKGGFFFFFNWKCLSGRRTQTQGRHRINWIDCISQLACECLVHSEEFVAVGKGASRSALSECCPHDSSSSTKQKDIVLNCIEILIICDLLWSP